jgi:MYXO-CTERM domain-containing protein
MLKTALLGLGLFWCAPATLFASVTSYGDQFEYPVSQSVLAALAAEQAKLPSLAETLKLLQEEQSKIPPLAEVLQRLADQTRALPPLGFVFTDERLVKLADAPEPQTWLLAALGLAAVGLRRKRNKPVC